jgi:ABC-type phosphonate transport system ATPase subunit
LSALQRRAFGTHPSTFSKAGQRTVTFDLWPPQAKRSSSSSHVSSMPREPATQHSPHACSTARNRHHRQRIALFERPDGNRHRVARTRSHWCFTGRHTKPGLKNP